MQRRTVLLGLASLAIVACDRWQPGYPRQVPLGSPDVAFDATMQTLKVERYFIQSVDDAHYTIHAFSKIDGKKNKLDTVLTFQIYDDGVLEVTCRGRLVRQEGREVFIHRKLEEEIETLMRQIRQTAVSLSAG
jgi:hypothetical protein